MKIQILSALSLAMFLAGCHSTPSKTTATPAMDITSVSQTTEKQGLKLAVQTYIVKLLYYSYKIRKKLEITHRLSRSTILYAYV